MRFQFRSAEAHRYPLTQLHYIASFKVKNDGSVNLIITRGPIPVPPVVVSPGSTSPPFTGGGIYYIRLQHHPPLPGPSSEIIVTFKPGKEIDAKSIGNPIDAEIIAKFV